MLKTETILRSLAEEQVEFIIIGGVAAVIHGSVHLTYDLDICYRRSRGNLERIVRALTPYHPRLRGKQSLSDLPFILDVRTLEMGLNFTLTTDLADIDLLGELTGMG